MQCYDDQDPLRTVEQARAKANNTGKPYCIVSAPSGGLVLCPLSQCKLEALETVYPEYDYPHESKNT